MPKMLDGAAIAASIKQEVAEEVRQQQQCRDPFARADVAEDPQQGVGGPGLAGIVAGQAIRVQAVVSRW